MYNELHDQISNANESLLCLFSRHCFITKFKDLGYVHTDMVHRGESRSHIKLRLSRLYLIPWVSPTFKPYFWFDGEIDLYNVRDLWRVGEIDLNNELYFLFSDIHRHWARCPEWARIPTKNRMGWVEIRSGSIFNLDYQDFSRLGWTKENFGSGPPRDKFWDRWGYMGENQGVR